MNIRKIQRYVIKQNSLEKVDKRVQYDIITAEIHQGAFWQENVSPDEVIFSYYYVR